MNKPYKVSIITVVYNGIAHLEQTIQSVLGQTYANIEYIIIDGGSNDGTVELIKKYDDKIAYWISERDNGIYDAMNKGIAKATGDIIGLINADDWYEPNAVQTVVKTFDTTTADVVHGSMRIIQYEKADFEKTVISHLDNLPKGMLLNHPTVFVKKELYTRYGFFDTTYRIVADWEMMIRWWLKGVNFVGIDDCYANFRMGGVSSEYLKQSFREKHCVRIQYKINGVVDWYYVYDKIKSLFPATMLLEISLMRQKRAG